MSIRRMLISWLTKKEVGASEKEWRDIQLSFSQFGEDLILQQILMKDNGVYLDIGANHPVRFSNTYHLHRFRGWRGVLVEPNPFLARILKGRRPLDTVIQVAIGAKDGLAYFEINPEHTLSRIVETKGSGKFQVIEVPVFCLPSLINKLPKKFAQPDLLALDCEGMDYEILSGNDWSRFRPRVICAESNKACESKMSKLLAAQGYALIANAQHSRIFALQPCQQS